MHHKNSATFSHIHYRWVQSGAGMILLFLIMTISSGCSAPPPAREYNQPTRRIPPTPIAQTNAPTLTLPTPLQRPAVVIQDIPHRWLRGEPCRAPCWEGITPGQTKAAEAVQALNQNSIVTNLEYCDRSQISNDCITWQWTTDSSQGGGGIDFPRQLDPVVTRTVLFFPKTSFHLREIIAAYGEPSHIIPLAGYEPVGNMSRFFARIVVVYLAQGFYLTSLDLDPATEISPDLNLGDQVTLFAPSTHGLDAAVDDPYRWDSADLVPWQGFQGFATYCQQAQASPYKVCQIP